MTRVLLSVTVRHGRLTPGIVTAISHLPGVRAVTRMAPVGSTDDGTVTVAAVRRKGTGRVRRLPSGRWQARATNAGTLIPAPGTFETRREAVAWLDSVNGPPDDAA